MGKIDGGGNWGLLLADKVQVRHKEDKSSFMRDRQSIQ